MSRPGNLCGSPSKVLVAKKNTTRNAGAISNWSNAILESTAGMLHVHQGVAHMTSQNAAKQVSVGVASLKPVH